jgi:hypothetical protein
MQRTDGQHRQLFALIKKLGIDEETRKDLIRQFTNNRTDSSRLINYFECNALIRQLQTMAGETPANKVTRNTSEYLQNSRRQIFKLFWDCGFFAPKDTTDDKLTVINNWIATKTQFNKEFNSLNTDELLALNKQLQTVRRNYKERINKQAQMN